MIHHGDVSTVLPTLEAQSVQCVVTSPPYWGLRDYGTASWEGGEDGCDHIHQQGGRNPETASKQLTSQGTIQTQYASVCRKCGARRIDQQIGLESSPAAYVQTLVAVFREIRRVLKKDGTVWLNLGSSYASGDTNPNPSLSPERALSCDSDGTALLDSPPTDRACPCCDGGHRDAMLIRYLRSVHIDQSDARTRQQPSRKVRGNGRVDSAASLLGASPLDVPESTTLSLAPNGRDVSGPATRASVSLPVIRSSASEILACVCNSCLNHTRFSQFPFKAKDMIPTPWMVAFALQEDGWYLRSDVVWNKNNPMPESVKDRPTRSHEYVFLLTKEPRYYYNAEAIAEPLSVETFKRFKGVPARTGSNGLDTPSRSVATGQTASCGAGDDGLRNARTVWTINPQPYPEAHFATFPEELARRCILAGSREGDTVLDPFTGAGTVGTVCALQGREFVGIELNAAYIQMAQNRIADSLPLLRAL